MTNALYALWKIMFADYAMNELDHTESWTYLFASLI